MICLLQVKFVNAAIDSAAKATVQAATGMSDDDDDVPLFPGTHRPAASSFVSS